MRVKSKKYLFAPRNDWVGRILEALRLAPRHKHLSIFGIQASGKSYFLMSLAYFISQRGLGRVIGESVDYVNQFMPMMMRGERLDATTGYRDIELEVQRIYRANYEQVLEEVTFSGLDLEPPALSDDLGEVDKDSDLIACDYQLSTNDLSGEQFEQAMARLSEPTAQLGADPQTRRFLQILDSGEGAIIAVDIVRQVTDPEVFKKNRVAYVRQALAEQVVPLVRGIQLSALQRDKTSAVFPLFLVFTKRDIHQYPRAELEQVVREVFAILLAGLDDYVRIRVHCVQNIGFGVDPESILQLEVASEGIGFFLADLYYWLRQM